jgi:hypothetical protein
MKNINSFPPAICHSPGDQNILGADTIRKKDQSESHKKKAYKIKTSHFQYI